MDLNRAVGMVLVSLVALAGCGDGGADAPSLAGDLRAGAVPEGVTACHAKAHPQPDGSYAKLSDTGLYCDISRGIVDQDAKAYALRYSLWADGADKLRYLKLPSGARIDTRDMDGWIFPVGTKVWKQFSLDGVKIETRLLEKKSDGEWFMMPFAWDDAEQDAYPVPEGEQNAHGTPHDIPSTGQCQTCHGRTADVLNGVAALELASANPRGVTLAKLVQEQRLTDPPRSVVRFPGDPVAAKALGYLYANCAECHRGPEAPAGLDLSTSVEDTEVETTRAYVTAVDQPLRIWVGRGYTLRIDPGHPGGSAVIARMSTRVPANQMPKIDTEVVDEQGVQTVSDWIQTLK